MQHTVTQRKTDNNHQLIPLLANQTYLQGRTVLYSIKLQLFRSFFLSPSLTYIIIVIIIIMMMMMMSRFTPSWLFSSMPYSSSSSSSARWRYCISTLLLLIFIVHNIQSCHSFTATAAITTSRFITQVSSSSSSSSSSELQQQTRPMEIWWDRRRGNKNDNSIINNKDSNVDDDNVDVWIVDKQDNKERRKGVVVEKKKTYYIDAGNKLKDVETQTIVGVVVSLNLSSSSSGQEDALAAIGSVEWVLVDIEIDNDSDSDTGEEEAVWQMIPAENLIAAAQYTGTKIAFCVSRSQDVIGLSNALELGVDALCIKQGLSSYDDPDLWKSVFQARIERNNAIEKDLVDGKSSSADDGNSINKYKPQITIGSCWRRDTTSSLSSSSSSSIIADRICIDFVQTLKEEEGCWIGSSSKIMALILSENSPSEYVPTRPFRVNAGPVHSYILMGDEKETIKYLCELMAADSVSVYNTVTKTSRSIIIGRIKQEIRPCIIVELEQTTPKEVAMISSEIYTINGNDDDYSGEIDRSSSSSKRQQLLPSSSGQIFLQQAETVRLGQKDGNYIRATDLKVLQSSSSQSQSQQQQVAVNNSKSDRHTKTACSANNINNNSQAQVPLLLRVMTTGTHIGKIYTGTVQER